MAISIAKSFSVACAVLALFAGTAALAQGDFIRDIKSDCAVWNPNPAAQETISYKGSCTGGLAEGEGTLIWYFQSVESWIYIGHFEGGKFNGQGKLAVADGTVVEGYWKNNQISHGISASADGRTREGFFKDGRLTGLGRFTYEDGSVHEGTFLKGLLQGEGKITYADGTVVSGMFAGGKLVQ